MNWLELAKEDIEKKKGNKPELAEIIDNIGELNEIACISINRIFEKEINEKEASNG